MESNVLKKQANEKIEEYRSSLFQPDKTSMLYEFNNGKRRGEHAGVEQMAKNFSWKRNFVQCWTGYPNHGKTEFLTQMAIIKSKMSDWRWCVWSPEMMSTDKNKKRNANEIYDMIVHVITGKNPDPYWKNQPTKDEYMEAIEWAGEHFTVIYPRDRRYRSLIENFRYWYETKGFDGFVIDPFKNITHDYAERFDLYLQNMFADFQDFATETDSVVNFVAHPKSGIGHRNPDGSYKVCGPFDLSGGSAWNDSMDAIFSVHRPRIHEDLQSPEVDFYSVKIRKQNLVGRTGFVDGITFDIKTNRYYFNGRSPLEVTIEEAGLIPFKQIENGEEGFEQEAPF